MAANVYGIPITDETLKALPEYMKEKNITAKQRAKVALFRKNAEGKDVNARKFVENLQERFLKLHADHAVTSTMILLYNATGDPLTLISNNSWAGHIGESPYPVIICNGQWGAFLHVLTNATPSGDSKGGVMYKGQGNKNGESDDSKVERYWVLCWQSSSHGKANKILTKVCLKADPKKFWDDILPAEWKDVHTVVDAEGGWLAGSIGNTMNPICEAIYTLSSEVLPK